MIQWNLTLSGNQIAILKGLASREFGKPWDMPDITQWVGGTRTLIREGLIQHIETKVKDKPYQDQTRSGQFLTERGRFILSMIEADIEKFLKPQQLARVRKLRRVG